MKATLMEADEESLDEEDMVRAFQEEERIRKQALLEVMKEGDAKKSRRRQRDGSGQLIDLPPLSPEEQVFHQPPPRACADAQNRSGAREESIVTAPRGFRRPRSPRAWVPESPEPTPRGFRSPRSPRPPRRVGSEPSFLRTHAFLGFHFQGLCWQTVLGFWCFRSFSFPGLLLGQW